MTPRVKSFLSTHPLMKKWALLASCPRDILRLKISKRIRGTANRIKVHPTSTLLSCSFDVAGIGNEITINESCALNGVTIFVRGDNNRIHIKQGVRFNRGGEIWMEDHDCKLTIGEKTTFEDVHIAVTEPESSVEIGADCMFAYDIDVRTGDSHSIIDSKSMERINYAQNIIIDDHVWVASHVSILKGTHVARDSIVATRAVVTKPFAHSNVIIGGSPARIIKDGVSWTRERISRARI